MSWPGEVCKRCHRRNCVGFAVDDETWLAVAQGFNVLCTTCFDEMAEARGVAYRFVPIQTVYSFVVVPTLDAVSWSDWTTRSPPGRVRGLLSLVWSAIKGAATKGVDWCLWRHDEPNQG